MFPTIPIGPLQLQTFGIFLLLAYWLGLWLSARLGERQGLGKDHVYNAGFYALLAGLVGARLGHVVLFFEVYRTDPLQMFSLSPGALVPLAGLIAALAALALYVARHRLSAPRLADVLAPGILLAIGIADVGAFLAGRTLGTLSELPWAVELFGVKRHPVALYEALAVFSLLGLVLWLDWKQQRQPGWLALVTLFGYATIRLFLEPLRVDGGIVGDGWRVAQIVALVVVAISGILLARMAGGGQRSEDQKSEGQRSEGRRSEGQKSGEQKSEV